MNDVMHNVEYAKSRILYEDSLSVGLHKLRTVLEPFIHSVYEMKMVI